MEDVTEKEISDVFSEVAKDFVTSATNDSSLGYYVYDNINSLVKILFIDKENITVII